MKNNSEKRKLVGESIKNLNTVKKGNLWELNRRCKAGRDKLNPSDKTARLLAGDQGKETRKD